MRPASFALPALACASLLTLAACAGGRDPQPMAISQPDDAHMNCTEIKSELVSLNERFPDLVSRKAEVWRKNARLWAGVPSMGASAIYMMEDGEAQEVELSAAQKRFYRLADHGIQKGCRMDDTIRPVMAPPNNDWAEHDTFLYPSYGGYEQPHDYPHETIRIVKPGVGSNVTVINDPVPNSVYMRPSSEYVIPPADHMRQRRDAESVFRDDYANTVGAPAHNYPVWLDGHYKTRTFMGR
ncbi:MAG: hypothetical protein Alpg2KO_03150 [Alphaproteobacteria bacterium]